MEELSTSVSDEAESNRILDKLKATSIVLRMLNFKDKDQEQSIKERESMWERLLQVKNNQIMDLMKKNAALQGQYKSKVASFEQKVKSQEETISKLNTQISQYDKERVSFSAMMSQEKATRSDKLSRNNAASAFRDQQTQTDEFNSAPSQYQQSDLSKQLTSSVEQEALSTLDTVRNSLRDLALILVNNASDNSTSVSSGDVLSLIEVVKAQVNQIITNNTPPSQSQSIREPLQGSDSQQEPPTSTDTRRGSTKTSISQKSQRVPRKEKDAKKTVSTPPSKRHNNQRSELPEIRKRESSAGISSSGDITKNSGGSKTGQNQSKPVTPSIGGGQQENNNTSGSRDAVVPDKKLPRLASKELCSIQNPPRGQEPTQTATATPSERANVIAPSSQAGMKDSHVHQNQEHGQQPSAKTPFIFAQEQRKAGRKLSNKADVLQCDLYIREQWEHYDTGRSGYLCKDEFKAVYKDMEHFGIEHSDRQINKILDQYSMLGDDKISFDEFSIIMLKLAAR